MSAQRISIEAASSDALSLVTSTPFFASSSEPIAILTVNIAGSATGTAKTTSTSARGTTVMMLVPSA